MHVFLAILLAGAFAISLFGQHQSVASKREASGMMLASTFTAASLDPLAEALIGEWLGDGVRIAILPRRSRASRTLTGVIPSGDLEGAVQFTSFSGPSGNVIASGIHVVADKHLKRERIQATMADGELRILMGGKVHRLRRSRGINRQRIANVVVIAHRGLSLDHSSLMNSRRGIEHAWLFGASGVELDVTVPYSEPRSPLPDALRIHHPSIWRSELTGFDSAPASELRNSLTPAEGLAAATAAELELVYFDPKLRWIAEREELVRRAIDNLANAATAALKRDPALRVLIGAETRQAAAALARARLEARTRNLGWAHELTRGTDPEYLLQLAKAPSGERSAVISWSLLRVRRTGTGVLGWFLPDVDANIETQAAHLEQPFIFWTASDRDHFQGALDALARMTPAGRTRQAGIITPHPHRLAYFLATEGQGSVSSGLRQ